MTTANLVVGIDSTPAKAALADLRERLHALANERISFNASKLVSDLQTSLAQKNFKIGLVVQTDRLKKEIESTIASALKAPRKLEFDLGGFAQAFREETKNLHVYLGAAQVSVEDGVKKKILQDLAAPFKSTKIQVSIDSDHMKDQFQKGFKTALAASATDIANQLDDALAKSTILAEARVGINEEYLAMTARRYLENPKVRFKAHIVPDARLFGAAMETLLAQPFDVNISEGALTAKVSRAVAAGMAIPHTPGVAGSGTGAAAPRAAIDTATLTAGLSTALTSAMVGAMTPAMDRMAMSVADAVRAAQTFSKSPKVATEPGAVRFAQGVSAKLQDGTVVRASQNLDAESGRAAIQGALDEKERLEKQAQLKKEIKARLAQYQRDEAASVRQGFKEIGDLRRAQMSVEDAWAQLEKQRQRERSAAWVQAERDGARQRAASVEAGWKEHEAAVRRGAAGAAQVARAQIAEFEGDQQQGIAQARLQKRLQERRDREAASFGPSRSDRQRLLDLEQRAWNAAAFGPSRSDRNRLLDQEAREQRRLQETQAASALRAVRGAASGAGSGAVDANRQAVKTWAAAANDAHSAARGLAGALGMLWLTWGSTVPIASAAAIGGTVRSVIKDGKDLEYQLKFVSVLTGETGSSYDEFASIVSGSLHAPLKAAEAMRAMAQNGLTMKESLAALPDILNLATAGEMSLSEAALSATGVMAAFNLQVSDLGHVGDVFTKAAALSNTSVQSMTESMKQASTVGDKYHVSLEETAAALAVMAKRNITGTSAGTAFRNMMLELATPSKKARDALKQLNLELYDNNNQLKSFDTVLSQLRAKIATLDEKSKLNFLSTVFGERGDKAANALLSDFDKVNEVLQQIRLNADGFSKSVTAALQDTVEGKWRALISEFQLTTTAAFENSKSSVAGFLDQMRNTVATAGFKNLIQGLTDGVIALTRAVADNVGVIGTVVRLWVASRLAAAGLAGVLQALTVSATSAAGGVGALSVAMRALSATFGWVAAVGLGIYLLNEWASASDKTTQAVKNRKDALEVEKRALSQGHEEMNRRIQELELEAEAIIKGANATEARVYAEESLQKIEARKKTDAARTELANAKAARDENAQRSMWTRGPLTERDAAVQRAQQNYEEQLKAETDTEVAINRRKNQRLLELQNKSLGDIAAYNKRAIDLNKQFGKNLFPVFSEDYLRALKDKVPAEELSNMAKRLNANIDSSKSMTKFTPRDPHTETEANKLYNAEFAATQAANKRRLDELKEQASFQKKLDDLKYSPDQFGPYVSRVMEEARAEAFYTKMIEEETDAIAALAKVRFDAKNTKGKVWTPADEVRFQDAVSARHDSAQGFARQRKESRELARARQDLSEFKSSKEQASALSEIESKADASIAKLREAAQIKVEDPIKAGGDKAAFAVMEQNRESLRKLEDEINIAIAGRDQLMTKLGQGSEEEIVLTARAFEGQVQQVEVLKEQLRIRSDLVRLKAEEARKAGSELAAEMRTPEYGMKRFWAEFASSGESSADMVYKSMKSAADKSADALAKFVATGKLDFKGLVSSIIADLLRLQAQAAFRSLLGGLFPGLPGFGGGGGGGPGPIDPGWSIPITAAEGGVVGPWGVARLKGFKSGGVARRPTVSVIAEADKPEAYVPLNDGRSIPVTMSGGGGGHVTVNHHVTVNVDSRSDAAQVYQTARRAAADANKELVTSLKDGGYL